MLTDIHFNIECNNGRQEKKIENKINEMKFIFFRIEEDFSVCSAACKN